MGSGRGAKSEEGTYRVWEEIDLPPWNSVGEVDLSKKRGERIQRKGGTSPIRKSLLIDGS